MAKTLGAKELLSKLSDRALGMSFVGMVDSLDDDDGVVLFTGSDSCKKWIRVPVELIDSLIFLQTVPCGAHSHILARLTLKAPKSEEGRLLAELTSEAPATTDFAFSERSVVERLPEISLTGSNGLRPTKSPLGIRCMWVFDLNLNQYVYRCFHK